ncbi:hypothetical protein ROHU_009214 [Labeo rohita]|uniref:Uncharacterized protein n=1 Tax=Labeo rohita TaxID=84645 RepID=A0A498LZX0_LABRO|nr:hypothetical protein ROHU_009214 [Labeo rohita]
MEGLSLLPKGAAGLLHREGEPRPPPSTQRNFRRQMEGSHCDQREPLHWKGEPGPMLDKPKRFVTSGGGTLTATEGSFGSAAPGKRVPLATMYRARGAPLRPKGAVALLHREGEPYPPLSTQRNSNDGQKHGLMPRMEGSHCN